MEELCTSKERLSILLLTLGTQTQQDTSLGEIPHITDGRFGKSQH